MFGTLTSFLVLLRIAPAKDTEIGYEKARKHETRAYDCLQWPFFFWWHISTEPMYHVETPHQFISSLTLSMVMLPRKIP